MLELATQGPARPFSSTEVDEMTDTELDALPFGVVGLDAEGTILRYNLYESRLARLDRNQVLGREFFGEVAPCTAVESFGGRFWRMVQKGEAATIERFDFVFDFRFGAQQVAVEIVPLPSVGRYYLLINRAAIGPARRTARGRLRRVAAGARPGRGFVRRAPRLARAALRRGAVVTARSAARDL